MSSRTGKIASLTTMLLGSSAVALATALQLCSKRGHELFYNLGIDNLTSDDYLIHRIGLATTGAVLMYAGKKGYKYFSD